MSIRSLPLVAALLIFQVTLRPAAADPMAAPAPPAPSLLPPLALGGECGLLLSCPWSGSLAVHFRLRGLVWIGQPGDPRPVSVVPDAALSVSLWRWAEAGAAFGARAGSATDGSSAFLQLPPILFAKVSPPPRDSGLQVAAQVSYAIGRAPFDAGGTTYPDQESYGLSIGTRRDWGDLYASCAYQRAGSGSYTGVEVGTGLYLLAWQKMGLSLGGELVARLGGGPGEGLLPSWIGSLGLRFGDETGVGGTMGYVAGGGPGMPRHGPMFVFQLSFGPSYHLDPLPPGYEALFPLAQNWIGRQLRDLFAPRPAVPVVLAPPQLLATGHDPHRITPRSPAGAAAAAPGCQVPADQLPALALRTCVMTWPELERPTPGAGPAAPGPPGHRPPGRQAGERGVAQAPPGRAPAPPSRAGRAAESEYRYGRGEGWEQRGGVDPRSAEARTTDIVETAPEGPGGGAGRPPVSGIASMGQGGNVDRPLPPTTAGVLRSRLRPAGMPDLAPLGPRGDPPASPRPAPAPPRPADPPEAAPPPQRGVAEHARPPSGGIGPVLQGRRGVAVYVEGRPAQVQAQEVSFKTRFGIRRVDVVETDPQTGQPVATEIKTGRSPYKPIQRLKDAEIEAGRAEGVGARAREAGLAGPVKLQTKVVRLPSDGEGH